MRVVLDANVLFSAAKSDGPIRQVMLAGVAAYPLNRWLIARGRGHAVVHAHHGA